MSASALRHIPPALAAFHDAQAAAYYVSIDPTAAVTAYASALKSIEAPPELDSAEMEQLIATEGRLLTKLAWSDPATSLELLMKVERSIAALLRSLEDGDRKEEVDLGRGALRDVRAAIRTKAELSGEMARRGLVT
jgi:hypothetical protein